jgi:hypothetical protein
MTEEATPLMATEAAEGAEGTGEEQAFEGAAAATAVADGGDGR